MYADVENKSCSPHEFSTIEEAILYYETLVEHLGADFALVDKNKNILCVTKKALSNHIEKKDAIGKNFFEVFSHLRDIGFDETMDRVMESKKPYIDLYAKHTTVTGLSGYFHRKFLPIELPDLGTCIIAMIENVNEHRLAELHAHESEFRYQRLIETMSLISFRLDATGRFTYVNNASLGIFEWSPAEIVGTSLVQYLHPDDVGTFWRVFWHVVNHDQRFGTVENRIVTRTGIVKHIRWNIHPVYDNEGKIIGSQGVGEDITSAREVMQNLQEGYGKYKGFFNALPVPVCIVSKDDKIMSANRSMCKMIGYSQKEMRNKTIFDILPIDHLDESTKLWTRLKERGGIPRKRFVFMRKDKAKVVVMLNGVRFGDYLMLISERIGRTS